MRYEYAIARFVPDLARGEFVNLGLVVVGGGQTTVRWTEGVNRRRVASLHKGAEHLPAAREALMRVEDTLARAELAEDALNQTRVGLAALAADYRNVVQFTDPAPISATDIEEAAELLADLLLTDIEHAVRGVTRGTARKQLRRSLRDQLPESAVLERAVLTAGDKQQYPIDFAVRNGEVRQLSHAWSFHGPSSTRERDLQAWAWVMDNLKSDGGRLEFGDRQEDVDRLVDVEVYVLPPQQAELSDEFDRALRLFESLEVVVTEDPDTIAMRAEELLGVH